MRPKSVTTIASACLNPLLGPPSGGRTGDKWSLGRESAGEREDGNSERCNSEVPFIDLEHFDGALDWAKASPIET